MSKRRQLIQTLQQYPSVEWINQSFDLLREMLTELDVKKDDPRLTMFTVNESFVEVLFGTRSVFQLTKDQKLTVTVPFGFTETTNVRMSVTNESAKRKQKWLVVDYPIGAALPLSIQEAWMRSCLDVLRRSRKAKIKALHQAGLYDFTMEAPVRNETLGELKTVVI